MKTEWFNWPGFSFFYYWDLEFPSWFRTGKHFVSTHSCKAGNGFLFSSNQRSCILYLELPLICCVSLDICRDINLWPQFSICKRQITWSHPLHQSPLWYVKKEMSWLLQMPWWHILSLMLSTLLEICRNQPTEIELNCWEAVQSKLQGIISDYENSWGFTNCLPWTT